MHNPSLIKIIKKTTLIISLVLCFFSFSFTLASALSAAGNRGYSESGNIPDKKKGSVILKAGSPGNIAVQKEKGLSSLQREARAYRSQGLEYQRIGNLDAAMELYQKAIELDPLYAVVYNDLGITLEEMDRAEQAEEYYLQAIKVDEGFLSPYSNLALLYETRRDLDKAAFYWRKRAGLGSSLDPWTKKARQRLSDIMMVQTGAAAAHFESREQAVFGLIKDVQHQKAIYRGSEQELAKAHFQKAKSRYEKGDEVGALSEAFDAKQLDSSNKEIDEFIDRVLVRFLTR